MINRGIFILRELMSVECVGIVYDNFFIYNFTLIFKSITMNSDIKTPEYVIALAREMRLNMTATEKLLWSELKSKKLDGFKFRAQHSIYRYILDFYCSEMKLAIEIDGDIHKHRKDYDNFRDGFLDSMGIKTIRFKNEDVKNNIDIVLEQIKKGLNGFVI